MSIKTMEGKIKKVCWWVFGLSVLYFVLGAILKSDGCTFDPTKTYDLLKDTLTLTAAFLAPVAAFVLFTNWREEYELKSLFELLESIKSKAKGIEKQLVNYSKNIKNRKILVGEDPDDLIDSEQLTDDLIEFGLLYREIDQRNENISEYINLLEIFYKSAKRAGNLLYVNELKSIIIKKYESLNISRAEEEQIYPIPEKDIYDKNYQEFLENLEIVQKAVNDLIFETKKIKAKS